MPRRDDADDPCDLQRFTRNGVDTDAADLDVLSREVRGVVQRTVASLHARPDDSSRAAADLLTYMTESRAADEAERERRERQHIDCEQTPTACPPSRPAAASKALEALVQRAVLTSDPWAYGLAYQMCARSDGTDRAAACQMINVARWAQLDPDNAVPWWFAANEAQQRQDAAGLDEALYRAAHASRNELRFARSVQLVRDQMPADTSTFVGFGLDVGLVGLESAFALPSYAIVGRYCSAAALIDPARRAVCEGLASTLVERSSTLLDLGIGLSIARRLGWPVERLAPYDELRGAIYAFQMEWFSPPEASQTPFSACGFMRMQREALYEVGLHGELPAYRSRVEASAPGLKGYAAKRRAGLAKAAAEAASAISTRDTDSPSRPSEAAAPQRASAASAVTR